MSALFKCCFFSPTQITLATYTHWLCLVGEHRERRILRGIPHMRYTPKSIGHEIAYVVCKDMVGITLSQA